MVMVSSMPNENSLRIGNSLFWRLLETRVFIGIRMQKGQLWEPRYFNHGCPFNFLFASHLNTDCSGKVE